MNVNKIKCELNFPYNGHKIEEVLVISLIFFVFLINSALFFTSDCLTTVIANKMIGEFPMLLSYGTVLLLL